MGPKIICQVFPGPAHTFRCWRCEGNRESRILTDAIDSFRVCISTGTLRKEKTQGVDSALGEIMADLLEEERNAGRTGSLIECSRPTEIHGPLFMQWSRHPAAKYPSNSLQIDFADVLQEWLAGKKPECAWNLLQFLNAAKRFFGATSGAEPHVRIASSLVPILRQMLQDPLRPLR